MSYGDDFSIEDNVPAEPIASLAPETSPAAEKVDTSGKSTDKAASDKAPTSTRAVAPTRLPGSIDSKPTVLGAAWMGFFVGMMIFTMLIVAQNKPLLVGPMLLAGLLPIAVTALVSAACSKETDFTCAYQADEWYTCRSCYARNTIAAGKATSPVSSSAGTASGGTPSSRPPYGGRNYGASSYGGPSAGASSYGSSGYGSSGYGSSGYGWQEERSRNREPEFPPDAKRLKLNLDQSRITVYNHTETAVNKILAQLQVLPIARVMRSAGYSCDSKEVTLEITYKEGWMERNSGQSAIEKFVREANEVYLKAIKATADKAKNSNPSSSK